MELNNRQSPEIKRLGAKTVYILGGKGAVSKNVENTLTKNNLNVIRIYGKTRYSTATAIAEKLNEKPTDVFFVYGEKYADALSVSTVAALKKAPVIYLTKSGELNTDTASYLAKLKKTGSVKNAYIIGGKGVISDDMMSKAVKALGLSKETRVSGSTRYETCVEVNKQFSDDMNGDMLCVATGTNFPDALAGGVYASKNSAPLFLVDGKATPLSLSDKQKTYLKAKNAAIFAIFGGKGVVPDDHITEITKNS